MEISFYTLDIHQPLQQLLLDADRSGDWLAVIDYCEPLIETTEDDNVILCYVFASMEQALQIHVDDVAIIGNKCLALMKRIKHQYGGTFYLARNIKAQIKIAKQKNKTEYELNEKPIAVLSISDKSKLAFNLHDKGGVENCKKAAEIYLDLLSHSKGQGDESYNYGNYVMCLYASNQVELADQRFDEFLTWMSYYDKMHYSFMVGNCFQAKILCHKHDPIALQRIWNDAMSNDIVKKHDAFPIAYSVQDELLIAADTLGLTEIKTYLIALIIKERKPRTLSSVIKNLINS